ncbi:MAG: adenosylcobinamide-GDP ribazoletransferase [Dehalococcoidales bacterium]|nr:adenosylcobinamide-GDP ribazoletransferase [Dehalococcoidales bacterium]
MDFYVALRFLTVLPLPDRPVKPEQMARSTAYFPLVGLMIGLAVAGVDYVLRLVWPPSVATVGVLIAFILISGGLHLDGLMDSCDGLFGRRDPAKRLAIMRDSRVGSFGVLGAVAVLLLEYVALAELPVTLRIGAIVTFACLGRWALVLAIWGFPYARAEGLGSAFKAGVGPLQVAVAGATAVAVAIIVAQSAGIVLVGTAVGATLLVAAFTRTRIPGLTGDSYGAIEVMVELTVLLTLLALARVGYA